MIKKTYRVNFHSHSTYSDGKLSVYDLVHTMHRNKVQWFALTDHDTVAGVAECQKLSQAYGINCITGIELSVPFDETKKTSFHLLGFDFDIDIFIKKQSNFYQNKRNVLIELYNHLTKDGYAIDLKENQLHSTTDLAHGIKQAGTVKELSEAYDLINQYPHFSIPKLTPEKAIKIIHDSNGFAVLAHPFDILKDTTKTRITESEVYNLVRYLQGIGLDGIEVFYSNFSQKQITFLDQTANKLGLIKSLGTDYHAKTAQDTIFINVQKQERLLLNALMNRRKNSM